MVYCYKVLNCALTYDSPCSFLCYVYVFDHLLCSCTFFFTYKIVSSMYSEYTVNIFRFLKLFLHDSSCFSPAVYLTALFWRAKILVVLALELLVCPHATIPYDRIGYIKP
jgi:hypothetical protein